MKQALLLLDPNAVHARLSRRARPAGKRRDRGFSLIETLAAMAIIAIISLGIVPQFAKYMERAAVQNVIQDVESAQILIDNDFGLSGSPIYNQTAVSKSVTDTSVNPGTTLTATVNTATNSYKIAAASTSVQHYTISYDSSTSSLSVKRN